MHVRIECKIGYNEEIFFTYIVTMESLKNIFIVSSIGQKHLHLLI